MHERLIHEGVVDATVRNKLNYNFDEIHTAIVELQQGPAVPTIERTGGTVPLPAHTALTASVVTDDGVFSGSAFLNLPEPPAGTETISYPGLEIVADTMTTVDEMESLTSLSYPDLKCVANGAVGVVDMPALTSWNIDALEWCQSLTARSAPLTSINAPKLKTVNGIMWLYGLSELESINLPLLQRVSGNLRLENLPVTEVSLSSLEYVGGNISLEGSQIDSLGLPLLQRVNGDIDFANCPLSEVSLPFLEYVGGTVSAYGCALSQSSVDELLATLASLDGFGGSFLLDGGTNASPSSAGRADAITLANRGQYCVANADFDIIGLTQGSCVDDVLVRGTVTIAGNFEEYLTAGEGNSNLLDISESTGNNFNYRIYSAALDGSNTVITIDWYFPDDTADGRISRVVWND